MKTTLYNGAVVLPTGVLHGGVTVVNGLIERVFSGNDFTHEGEFIDCRGLFISPGFIDIHTHGTMDGSTMDGTPEALGSIARQHVRHGTTALLATTLSSSSAEVMRALENVSAVMASSREGAKIIGAHLEGNYFSPAMSGAQNPAYLYPPQAEEYLAYAAIGCVKRVSAAPELPGSLEMARNLVPMGIQLSMGHSNGGPEDVERAIEAGYTSLTHIYNAESCVSSVLFYPELGISEAALLHDEIRVECICDGNHLSPSMLKYIYKIKGADGMIGITDAVYAGAPNGFYKMGGLDVRVADNICLLKDSEVFAGSVATMDLCVRTLYKKACIPLHEAVTICSLTPAKVIRMDDEIGRLAKGYRADINVFDADINVKMTLVDGVAYGEWAQKRRK